METEAALEFVRAEVLAKTGKPLSDIEAVVLEGAWNGKTYEEMAVSSGYAVNSLKNDAGPRFWKTLSLHVFGEKVSKANLRAVLDRQTAQRGVAISPNVSQHPSAIAPMRSRTTPRIDWGEAPNLGVFYGRIAELEALQFQIMAQKSQLIAVLGLRGIGKTTLSVKLVETLQTQSDQFEQVIWRSLFHDPPPALHDLLADLLKSLSGQAKLNLPATTDERLSLLVEQLQKHRCLVILDSFKSLMQAHLLAGQYKRGYEEYGELLKRIGMEHHQSCLVLTSQDCPQEVVELEAQQFPVKTLAINGLALQDAKQILLAKGLSDETYWETLIDIFQSNPLALQLVSAKIQRSFGGQVSSFLKQKTITTRHIVDLIDQQFQSLSTLEKEITYWLAVSPFPLSFADLRNHIPISGAVLLDALESLLQRSLIQGEAEFTLEPIVRQYVLNEFKKEALDSDLPNAEVSIQKLLERCYESNER